MTGLAEVSLLGGGNATGRDDGRLAIRLGRLEMVARQLEPLVWGMARPQGETVEERLERLLSLSPEYAAEPAWWVEEEAAEAVETGIEGGMQEMGA